MKKPIQILIITLLAVTGCQGSPPEQEQSQPQGQTSVAVHSPVPTQAPTKKPAETLVPPTFTPTQPLMPSPTVTPSFTLDPLLLATPRYDPVLKVVQEKNIAYTMPSQPDVVEQKLDIYHPEEKGSWPTVVIVPAIGNYRGVLTSMALGKAIAGQGAVVLVPDVGTNDSYFLTVAANNNGAQLRQVQEEILCVLRFARAQAEAYGGDPGDVILLGTGLGGLYSLDTALQGENVKGMWDDFAAIRGGPPEQAGCIEQGGLPTVGALVGYMGEYYTEDLKNTDADLANLMDPNANVAGGGKLKITFLHMLDDPNNQQELIRKLKDTLSAAGNQVQLLAVNPATHSISSSGPELGWITNAILQYANP